MPIAVTKTRAKMVRDAIHAALAAGGMPIGQSARGGGQRSAVSIAAAALGENVSTLHNLVRPSGQLAKLGFPVNWSRYKAAPPPPPAAEADPIELRRVRDRLARSERLRTAHERQALTEAALRVGVMGLTAEPLRPPSWPPGSPGRDGNHREAVVLFLSDVHMGEVIDLQQMGGRNSYNQKIALTRLSRYFSSVVKLGTKHWSGPPPAVIYLVLGGDLISGEIHEELAKTNDLLSIPAVKTMAEATIAGVNLLLSAFPDLQIRVVSVPGNHGRTTRKPEAKAFAVDSYDTLVAWAVERWFQAKSEKRVTFSAPASGDALVNIMGWKVLFTHGDRIGSRGGQGFVGPAATAARGMKKMVQDFVAEGEIVDLIVMGHLHTALELEEGFVNSSLAGPSEYSRSSRFRSKPATQLMLSIHPEHGVARRWQIQVGHPSEGSIYRGRV